MLSDDAEREVLYLCCMSHPVARCARCREDVTGAQVGADLVGGRRDLCPSCRTDLTDALRLHVLACEAVRATLRAHVQAGRDAIDASRLLLKRSEELKTRSEILAAESEALAALVLATLRGR